MAGHHRFAPGSCERLEPFLTEHVVGQELALRQFCDAVCDLARGQNAGPGKPLIMSGPCACQPSCSSLCGPKLRSSL